MLVEARKPNLFQDLFYKVKRKLRKKEESNLVKHARSELTRAGLFKKDSDYDGELGKAILELVQKLSDQDHSGFSAGETTNMFVKLARFEPITPLTGEDDEWMEIGTGVYQNKRCSRVFKDVNMFNGQAYDLDGKVFRDKNGVYYTSSVYSRVPITFPYTPKTEYVDE